MADHIITSRGTVKLTGESGTTYELRPDFNALCDFEEFAGKSVTDLFVSVPADDPDDEPTTEVRMGLRDIRALFRAFARIGSDRAAGEAVADVGFGPASGAVGEAVALAMGGPDDVDPEAPDVPGEA